MCQVFTLFLRGWWILAYFAVANVQNYRGVEQLEAREVHSLKVVGSSPTAATFEVMRSLRW